VFPFASLNIARAPALARITFGMLGLHLNLDEAWGGERLRFPALDLENGDHSCASPRRRA